MTTRRVYQPTTGLLDSIQATGPGTVGALTDMGYKYDVNRNVTERNDHVNQRVESYGYDALNRLDEWSTRTGSATPGTNTIYTYSPVGDLKTETVRGPDQPEQITTFRYGEGGAPAGWLTSRDDQKYGYDRTGQQISGPNRTVEYNNKGLPTVLTRNSGRGQLENTTFAYDTNGARVVKREADLTVITVGGLFERRSYAGGETANFHNIVVDGRVVAQLNRSQDASGNLKPVTRLTYLHGDLLGSTVALSNDNGAHAGAGDAPPQDFSHDPFGRRINAADQSHARRHTDRVHRPRTRRRARPHQHARPDVRPRGPPFHHPRPYPGAGVQPDQQSVQLRHEQPGHAHRSQRIRVAAAERWRYAGRLKQHHRAVQSWYQ